MPNATDRLAGMTSSTATFNDVCEMAAAIAARYGPFVEPRDVQVTKALFDTIPDWCHAVIGRVPDRHPRFRHPVITEMEMALLLAASRLSYEPDAADPDVPVADR